MVAKVQPQLLRHWSVNKLLGVNNAALQSDGAAAQVMFLGIQSQNLLAVISHS